MRIGALRVELFISDSNSLKAKRTVIKSLKERIARTFNVSISEVDDHDKWQKGVFGIAAVGSSSSAVNGVLDKVLDFIRNDRAVRVIDFEMEIL